LCEILEAGAIGRHCGTLRGGALWEFLHTVKIPIKCCYYYEPSKNYFGF
jgi:hypothetical protein